MAECVPPVPARLRALRAQLVEWLVDAAYPLWARLGIDPRNGGFAESISQNGAALAEPRRARVQPRQAWAFAQAADLGWHGDAARIVRGGLDYFMAHYRRPDGFFRTLAGVDGAVLDERALLYDQAFALLGYAGAATALDARREFEKRALALRGRIESRLRAGDGAFRSLDAGAGRVPARTAHGGVARPSAIDEAAVDEAAVRESRMRESNPHMHLLEACLAWAEIGNDPGWVCWVEDLVGLALSRFIRPDSGAIGEVFTASASAAAAGTGGTGCAHGAPAFTTHDAPVIAQNPMASTVSWQPAAGLVGRRLEPGHQFEWGWLLLRAETRLRRQRPGAAPLRTAALRLIGIGEDSGVRGDVAVNALLDDFTVIDANARLWPQTERCKAAVLAARLTGAPGFWAAAEASAASLLPYLATPLRGLWFDTRLPDGDFLDTPAPASSLYHLVGAIAALDAIDRVWP